MKHEFGIYHQEGIGWEAAESPTAASSLKLAQSSTPQKTWT